MNSEKTKQKIRAKNNRTTFVAENEINVLKKKLLLSDDVSDDNFENKTIHGDIMDAAKKLPKGFVDLLFIDPPYNLNKDFGNNAFRVKKKDDYEELFEKWLLAIIHTLKSTA